MTRDAQFVLVISSGMDSYQAGLLRGIRSVLARHGLADVLCVNGPYSPGLPPTVRGLLLDPRVCGVIVTPVSVAAHEQELDVLMDRLQLPRVQIGKSRPGSVSVQADNAIGMRELLTHLLDDCGARRPLIVLGALHQYDSRMREQVVREELAARGLEVDEGLVLEGNFRFDITYQRMRGLLAARRDFDAVVAFNDQSAIGALEALAVEGIEVPDEVMVTGFDNEAVGAATWPGVTTVDQTLAAQGEAAAEALLAQLAGGSPGDRLIPSRLVVRGSTSLAGLDLEQRLAHAAGVAREGQRRAIAQDLVVALTRALQPCRSLAQVVEVLTEQLRLIGMSRLFLAIHQVPLESGPPSGAGRSQEVPRRARLLLDYREGRSHPVPAEPFDARALLPGTLAGELAAGGLSLAPLMAGGEELGYLLIGRSADVGVAGPAIHLDLMRTLEAVIAAEAIDKHAAGLEKLVSERTAELREEVDARRHAEAQLLEEVAIGRRWEAELQRANAELQRSLMLDGMTRIANRTAFERHLTQHWHTLREVDRPFALIMIDVDYFKPFNDLHGHVAGDEALRRVGEVLEAAVREPADLACRYGGEEFAVLLPGTGRAGARIVAGRIQTRLAELAIAHGASPIADVVTVSVGIASCRPAVAPGPDQLVARADVALYAAKAAGRNQVCSSAEELHTQARSRSAFAG